jgi:hypothetical protein
MEEMEREDEEDEDEDEQDDAEEKGHGESGNEFLPVHYGMCATFYLTVGFCPKYFKYDSDQGWSLYNLCIICEFCMFVIMPNLFRLFV